MISGDGWRRSPRRFVARSDWPAVDANIANLLDEFRSLDLFKEAAIGKPPGMFGPRLVVRLPVAEAAVAEEALDVVGISCWRNNFESKLGIRTLHQTPTNDQL